MTDAIIYLATSFWIGAVHAATPGHGKTIAAAYIVGARGKPVDAVIRGVFVTLSPTTVSCWWAIGPRLTAGNGAANASRRDGAITGILVIGIGFWTLWTQRELMLPLQGVATLRGTLHDHVHETAQHKPKCVFRPPHTRANNDMATISMDMITHTGTIIRTTMITRTTTRTRTTTQKRGRTATAGVSSTHTI